VVHGASCVTGIDLHITLAPVSSQEPLQLDCAGGAREAAGSDRPRGGELHHNATHWRSPLIERKDRVPNRNVRTIQTLRCQRSRLDFGRLLAPDAEHGRLQPASSPMAAIRRSRIGLVVPLYRPRDNLAMLHGGLAQPMRMSKRNMW
jgi:hypothetical protein